MNGYVTWHLSVGWSSTKPHNSVELQAKLFDLGLASRSATLPHLLYHRHHHKARLTLCSSQPPYPLLYIQLSANIAGLLTTHRQSDSDNKAKYNLSSSRVVVLPIVLSDPV